MALLRGLGEGDASEQSHMNREHKLIYDTHCCLCYYAIIHHLPHNYCIEFCDNAVVLVACRGDKPEVTQRCFNL